MNVKKPFAEGLYFMGLLLLSAAMPLSVFAMSVSQFLLVLGWLFSKGLISRLKDLRWNASALLVMGIFVLHLAGLWNTVDYGFALRDIRIKLPLLVLPLILSTGPALTPSRQRWILEVFVLSTFVATLISMAVLIGWTNRQVSDIREISIFVSHVRFGLFICLSIFICLHGIMTGACEGNIRKWMARVMLPWFVVFLFILESMTGIAILIIAGMVSMIWFAAKSRNRKTRWSLLAFLCIVLFSVASFVYVAIADFYNIKSEVFNHPATHTAEGNPYEHHPERTAFENGYPVWMYVSEKELQEAWPGRSSLPLKGNDRRGQPLKPTLIRYLTSKGFAKDRSGVARLTQQDIVAVENGIANVNDLKVSDVMGRVRQIIWEYDNYVKGNDPSGHSVMQRLEYWKAGIAIIQRNWLAGVGTGDLDQEFLNEYDRSGSPLSMRWRLRAHNQFLTFFIAFGIVGIAYYLFAIACLMKKAKTPGSYLYFVFWMIAGLSMMTEDTLETQAGVTFFAFFLCYFLFVSQGEAKKKQADAFQSFS